MPVEKPEAIYQAIKNADVGSEVIIHNSDGSIWCILKVIAKEDKNDR